MPTVVGKNFDFNWNPDMQTQDSLEKDCSINVSW